MPKSHKDGYCPDCDVSLKSTERDEEGYCPYCHGIVDEEETEEEADAKPSP